jgi:hypothetical protein
VGCTRSLGDRFTGKDDIKEAAADPGVVREVSGIELVVVLVSGHVKEIVVVVVVVVVAADEEAAAVAAAADEGEGEGEGEGEEDDDGAR